MIKVDATRISAPLALTDPNGKGQRERALIIAFYSIPGQNQDPPEFTAYKDDGVKHALEQLFNGKCAYCESQYGHVHPMEVEHYRPKAGVIVAGQLKRPGYFWLGGDWDNLLPTCIDCNRRRHKEMEGLPSEITGKGNLFPLRDEARRAQRPGDEQHEDPYLLNPRLDDPAQHLLFNANGTVTHTSDRGEQSIAIYGLQRKLLVERRKMRALQIESKLNEIENYMVRIGTYQDPVARADAQLDLIEAQAELQQLLKETEEYLGLAEQLLKARKPASAVT